MKLTLTTLKELFSRLGILKPGLGKDRQYIIENLSMLIASGMPITEALDAIENELHSDRNRQVVSKIKKDIDSGSPLWKSLGNTSIFPSYAVSLIRIGEESGRLSDNLHAISLQQRKDKVFISRIRSAMMYPMFVLSLTFIVGIGIAWFILPKLSSVFSNLKIDLPLITKVLIALGDFFRIYGLIILPILICCISLMFFFLFSFSRTKKYGQAILLSIPGIKRLILETELARFGYISGTLLDAGLPVTQALSSLAEAAYFEKYKEFYRHLAESVGDGNSFKKSFDAYPRLQRILPGPIQQLIESGEKSGSLLNVLLLISKNFEEQSETTAKNVSVMIEPILLVIVWLGVVAVALAVILPIYSLTGSL